MKASRRALILGRNILSVKLPQCLREHIYLIGASKSGKSSEMFNLIVQDVITGRSVGLIDPHGDLCLEVERALPHLIPSRRERRRRVTLLDPTRGAFGFNPLEVADGEDPYPFILELELAFKKLWRDSWGERMADILRNSFQVLAEHGLTLCELPQLLTDPDYREALVSNLENESARHYFQDRFGQLPQREQSTWVESSLNKVNQFIADPIIRAIVGQAESTVNFREVLDQPGSVLLIRLPKGKMKQNAFILGSLLICKLQEAALSRVDVPEHERRKFTLFIDEFQNFGSSASLSFDEILSESRKYGLNLVLAHQNLDQIDRGLLRSILGNSDCLISFRIQRRDAETIGRELFKVDIAELTWARENGLGGRSLAEQWEQHYNALTQLQQRQAYVVIKGQRPRHMKTITKPEYRTSNEQLRRQAEELMAPYCRPREEIEREIRERLQARRAEENNPTEF